MNLEYLRLLLAPRGRDWSEVQRDADSVVYQPTRLHLVPRDHVGSGWNRYLQLIANDGRRKR